MTFDLTSFKSEIFLPGSIGLSVRWPPVRTLSLKCPGFNKNQNQYFREFNSIQSTNPKLRVMKFIPKIRFNGNRGRSFFEVSSENELLCRPVIEHSEIIWMDLYQKLVGPTVGVCL
jgi:hypothetical protein